MAKSKKKWIQAMNMDEGAFTKKAKKAGKTVKQYAKAKKGDKGKTGKQARLAITFAKMNKKRKGY